MINTRKAKNIFIIINSSVLKLLVIKKSFNCVILVIDRRKRVLLINRLFSVSLLVNKSKHVARASNKTEW